MGVCESPTVATRISHKYQVLLDDGNRIMIPQGSILCPLLNPDKQYNTLSLPPKNSGKANVKLLPKQATFDGFHTLVPAD